MILSVDGRTYRGEALEVHGVDPGTVERAIDSDAASRGDDPSVVVRGSSPGPVTDRVGVLSRDATVKLRPTLAAVARSRGREAPQDGSLSNLRAELSALDPPEVDRRSARKALAEAGEVEAELHERVAELRGRVDTLEERGVGAEDARRRLREAAAALTEARTERIAAEERLDRLDRRVRESRDRRERRLRLEDRIDNLRRDAREHLAGVVWEPFRAALESVPGDATAGDEPGTFEGEDLTAALAAVRTAATASPVVLTCGRFPDARSASECLGTPVIRIH
jgi:hypothetical protein